MNGKVTAVIGAQYGSEGKGVVVAHIATEYDLHIRVGGPNAGHSFIYKGKKMKVQSVPVGWINPTSLLAIAAGGIVNFELLAEELDGLEKVAPGVRNRLWIDEYAGVISKEHHEAEGGVDGEIHRRIGSTGEGVGAARVARISRDLSKFKFAKDVAHRYNLDDRLHPSIASMAHGFINGGGNILLEGTQGSGLSLIHGPWPYVTSADTNVATMLADCGIAPRFLTDTIMVARTMPIRVAGNSGPLRGETTWEDLSARLGRDVSERTTVTKKIRRIGQWDWHMISKAVLLNGPTQFALNFVDYLDDANYGVDQYDKLTPDTKKFISALESAHGVPVAFVGTGGDNWTVIDRRPTLRNLKNAVG